MGLFDVLGDILGGGSEDDVDETTSDDYSEESGPDSDTVTFGQG